MQLPVRRELRVALERHRVPVRVVFRGFRLEPVVEKIRAAVVEEIRTHANGSLEPEKQHEAHDDGEEDLLPQRQTHYVAFRQTISNHSLTPGVGPVEETTSNGSPDEAQTGSARRPLMRL